MRKILLRVMDEFQAYTNPVFGAEDDDYDGDDSSLTSPKNLCFF